MNTQSRLAATLPTPPALQEVKGQKSEPAFPIKFVEGGFAETKPTEDETIDAAGETIDLGPHSDLPVVVDSPLPGYLPGTLKELVSPLIRTIELPVPVANAVVPGYLKRHIELQLKPDEATTLAQISAALDSHGARLADGKHVGASKPLAFRYLLQQIGQLFATPREQL